MMEPAQMAGRWRHAVPVHSKGQSLRRSIALSIVLFHAWAAVAAAADDVGRGGPASPLRGSGEVAAAGDHNDSNGSLHKWCSERGERAPSHSSRRLASSSTSSGQWRTSLLMCDLPPLKKPGFLKPWKLDMPALKELEHQQPRSFAKGAAGGGVSRLGIAKASFGGAFAAIVKNARDLAPKANHPVCEDLDFTSQLKGSFVKDEGTGHLQYHLAHCQPKRLTPPEALACLSGRHVAMVGDSLTRFQFISLARFLIHGRFQRPYDNEAEGLTVLAGPQPAGGGAGRQLMHPASTMGGGDRRPVGKDGLQAPTEGPAGTPASTGMSPAAWERFFERTQKLLSRRGCVNTTCRCYRNASDHGPGEDPLSRAHEYWRVRLTLEDSSNIHLSMGLVYAFPDFATAGVNGIRWAFTAAKNKPPDVVIFNMGIWWGYVHSSHRPPDVSIASVVSAFEEIFSWGAQYVKQQGLSTRLVYKTTTPIMDTHHTADNFWWMAWPTQIEPLLVPLARTYGWLVFDAREVVATANRQGVQASWDAMHLFPYVYQELNDLLLNALCSGTQQQ